MHIIPTTKQEWGRFVLFPFKAYTAVAFPCYLLFDHTHHSLLFRYTHVTDIVAACYLVSGVVLIIGGLIHKIAFKSPAASSDFVYGGMALVILFGVMPLFTPL